MHTYMLTSPAGVFLVIKRSQASPHSSMICKAYLFSQYRHCQKNDDEVLVVLSVFEFTTKRNLVFGLAIRDLIEAEPVSRRRQQSRHVLVDVVNVIELFGKRILHVNDEDLPICFAVVQEPHDAEGLHLLDLTDVTDALANFEGVEGIIVSLGSSVGMYSIRIFPSLSSHTY